MSRDSEGLDQVADAKKPKSTRSTRAKPKPRATPAPKKAAEDAVVIEEAPASEPASDAKAASKADEAMKAPADVPVPEADTEIAGPDPETPETPKEEPETPSGDAEPLPVASATVVQEHRGGFLPLALGGVVAAGLGAGAMYYGGERGWIDIGGASADLREQLAGQAALIEDLQAANATTEARLAEMPDIAPLTGAVAALEVAAGDTAVQAAETAGAVEALAARLEATDARLADVETQPIPEAELPAEVVEAFERQLADMLGTVDTRFSDMQGTLDAKLDEIESAQTRAAEAEAAAAAAARAAEARAALAEVQTAIDNGTGFAEALAVFAEASGADVPAALADVSENGVPTIASLAEGFPVAAREALKQSTQAAAEDGSVGPLTAFFRTQLGARSLEPREGDDPDAVLSRAEAAVKSGDIDGAMAEIGALPAAGQAAFAAWRAQAETRRAAEAALAELQPAAGSN